MMKSIAFTVLLVITLVYWLLVSVLGFEGFVAYAVQFSRICTSIAVLIIFVPKINEIFEEIPPPGRDYLLGAIILSWLSGGEFSVWNELGRIFGTDIFDGRIYYSSIAGYFSLTLVAASVLCLIAPSTAKRNTRIIAMIIGAVVAAAFVVIAPYFR